MGSHAVTLRVTPLLRMNASSGSPMTLERMLRATLHTVQAGSFEHAKSEMEIAQGAAV
jgi:hypothetical protein